MGFSQCSKVFSKDFWSQVPNCQAFVGLERGPGHFRSIALGFREPIEAQKRMSWDLSGCSVGFQWNFTWMFNFHGNFELFFVKNHWILEDLMECHGPFSRDCPGKTSQNGVEID